MTLRVFQLNCHNAYQAMTELRLKIKNCSNIVALLQEPYVNNKKNLANLPVGYDSFPGKKDGHKRMCIIASKPLKLTEIAELCSLVTTVVGGIIGAQKVIFCSAYMHYDLEAISNNLKAVVAYCKTNNFTLILGADSNVHVICGDPTQKAHAKEGKPLNSES